MSRRPFAEQLVVLRAWGADRTDHSFRQLLDHLLGTRELLLAWGADEDLATAGLFHSVYGTQSFDTPLVDLRDRGAVRDVTGKEAEELVFLFCVASRESFEESLCDPEHPAVVDRISGRRIALDDARFRRLCNLSAANWLEQRPRLPDSYREVGRERFARMRPLVLPRAAAALEEAYASRQ